MERFKHIPKSEYLSTYSDDLNMETTIYSEDELIFIIKHFNVSLGCILTTQRLTAKLCWEYILREDEKYCKNDRDREITLDDVMRFQKHLLL